MDVQIEVKYVWPVMYNMCYKVCENDKRKNRGKQKLRAMRQ
jgi:hypothetical protein